MDADRQLCRAFGLAVRRERERRGVSQEVLAELAGLHRTYIGSVERGERNITLTGIKKIATALRTSVATLVGKGWR
jgi:transcriptional regulator with XRE-family HTH domain